MKDVTLISIIVFRGVIILLVKWRTQKMIDVFVNEIIPKDRRRIFITNKTKVYQIDDTCSSDILDLKDIGPETNSAHGCVLVVNDKFSKIGWTVPLKSKTAQTKKDQSKNILTQKR